jgi:hypothetical protein
MRKKKLNQTEIIGDTAILYTSKGEPIYLDTADLPIVSGYTWHLNGGYACTSLKLNGKQTTISMHRLIMNSPPGLEVDHIDHITWRNKRENLRLGTTAENQFNSKIRVDNSSGYKGVSFNRKLEKWFAQIRVNGQKMGLGVFETKEAAACASYLAIKKYHGERDPISKKVLVASASGMAVSNGKALAVACW